MDRMRLQHRWLQNFETTQAKIEGWGLLGVERGVVSIICGCGHFANGSCSCLDYLLLLFSGKFYFITDNSLLTMSSKARKTACPFSAILIDTLKF